jgi:hypothetical protein
MVVDAHDQPVGAVLDALNAYVVRKIGQDSVWLFAGPNGFQEAGIDFYHSAVDCSDARMIVTSSGQGLLFYAQVHSGVVFYTRIVDPLQVVAVPVHAYEHVAPGQDATQPAVCAPLEAGNQSVGVVTAVVDPTLATLATPFRIK